jgi:hypothetical protein
MLGTPDTVRTRFFGELPLPGVLALAMLEYSLQTLRFTNESN